MRSTKWTFPRLNSKDHINRLFISHASILHSYPARRINKCEIETRHKRVADSNSNCEIDTDVIQSNLTIFLTRRTNEFRVLKNYFGLQWMRGRKTSGDFRMRWLEGKMDARMWHEFCEWLKLQHLTRRASKRYDWFVNIEN